MNAANWTPSAMPPLSLHHLTMLRAHPLELIEAAAAGGFDYCGLRLVRPMRTDPLVDVVGNERLISAIRQRLDATGVRLLDIEAIWLQPDTDIAGLVPALEVGRSLGAKHVVTVGHDNDAKRLLDNFCKLCEASAKLGMEVGIELITYCSIGTLPQAQALVAQSGQANARLLIDALQFFRSGATPAQLADIDSGLIHYAQICDGPAVGPVSVDDRRREARTSRQLPGEGELALADWFAALPRNIPISLEAPTLHLADLPFNEQARIAGDVTRSFIRQQFMDAA
jgi:sugar phosphate isomerase/epimerase